MIFSPRTRQMVRWIRSAHVRSVLTQTSLPLLVAEGRCDLGAWQGIYVWEHRHDGSARRLSVTAVAAPPG
jgi:thiamine phosphate synthase YjbQ (UPF0047 family)